MSPEDDALVAAPIVDDPWAYVPLVPMSVDDTGVPEPFLRELLLKTLWAYDKPTLSSVSDVMGLHNRVVDD